MTAPQEPNYETTSLATLAAALRVEHAAIWSYGVAAAFAAPERLRLVDDNAESHRGLREATAALLRAASAPVPPAAAGYVLPFEVRDPAAAAQLAAQVEEDCANAWRAVVENGDTEQVRDFAVDALTESAIRQAQWRAILGIEPATVPFPGIRG